MCVEAYKQIYITYQITNKINNRYYRGKTSLWFWLYDDYCGSGDLIKDAVKKYGRGNFTRTLDNFFYDEDECYKHEYKYVKTIHEDKMSYNLRPGGYGFMTGIVGDDNHNTKYTTKFLDNHYDPTKTIFENATIDGKYMGALQEKLVSHIKKYNLEYLPYQHCMGDRLHPTEKLSKIYDPTKSICENATIDGIHSQSLHNNLIKYVLENNLPHVKDQVCLGYDNKYSPENLAKLYDPSKTIQQNVIDTGKYNDRLYKMLIRYVLDNDLPHVAGQRCLGYGFKYSADNLDKLYDPTKTINQNTIVNGIRKANLRVSLIKHVVENDLPYVPNQRCIENYIKKHGKSHAS